MWVLVIVSITPTVLIIALSSLLTFVLLAMLLACNYWLALLVVEVLDFGIYAFGALGWIKEGTFLL